MLAGCASISISRNVFGLQLRVTGVKGIPCCTYDTNVLCWLVGSGYAAFRYLPLRSVSYCGKCDVSNHAVQVSLDTVTV